MLDLASVRAVAKEYGLKEVDLSKTHGSVSYISPFRSFRINVYYRSGSVVTLIRHPKAGMCQGVRRGVNQSLLKQIIREPEQHAGLSKYEGKVGKAPFGPAPPEECINGSKMWFVGLRSFREEIRNNWKPRKTLDFAVGPDSFLALGVKVKSKYHAWWSNIPKALKTTLRRREYELPAPVYAALGSGDRYFVRYENGSFEWVASKSFSKLIRRFPKVSQVAFGADWDSYHIVFQDGTQAWNNIPPQLEKILEKRNDNQPDVCEVSLCPDNPAYFHVVFSDGSWRSHGIPQVMEKQLYYGHCKVFFAGKGQCLLTYNEDVTEDEDYQERTRSDSDDSDYDDDDDYFSEGERYYDDDEWVTSR
mmetsp:Transcript_13979/g.17332  ORF Transcript_13979/g.17332 Transcript_13979/m.17332 type:complete len:361 (+) Transcript_13979:468-1550(+)|eukprot:CAMPEP_0204824566 /NCGR_PEP_ID=MMETSP1346-20131115/2554_1 /ASSEMBLY_ACC=CAM_ASM_000771 /TAXON_ID=215587 /ORGANISM="Aplanochytrium stocchinoi, Strain GSBS06" /LENGTH=360 /DNA_ID=CAMNT_0051951771 /DNA_START=468 /DNA_END=1550 /DNA_ORIENTATION=+